MWAMWTPNNEIINSKTLMDLYQCSYEYHTMQYSAWVEMVLSRDDTIQLIKDIEPRYEIWVSKPQIDAKAECVYMPENKARAEEAAENIEQGNWVILLEYNSSGSITSYARVFNAHDSYDTYGDDSQYRFEQLG
jgi:hypothetical protein